MFIQQLWRAWCLPVTRDRVIRRPALMEFWLGKQTTNQPTENNKEIISAEWKWMRWWEVTGQSEEAPLRRRQLAEMEG